MSYGSDITEALVYNLSNPAGATNYQATGYAYDIAINGQPFFLNATDETPYKRVTAQYRKQQYDQTREAGEQSLTGWWFRSQSSFHYGAGIKFFEPAQDESLRFQFTESKGLDIWTKGQATLLNDTASFYTGAAAAQLIGINDGTDDCIVFTDGSALKKKTSSGTVSTYTQAGTASTIYSLTTNGKQYFFINGTHVHRGNLAGTTSDTEIYNASSTTRATIRYVKQRLFAAINASIYELDANHSSGTLPTAFYTHPNTSWIWSSISESPSAIYISGYDPNGTSSSVFKITLDETVPNTLGFPTLNVPTVTVDLPAGEYVNAFDVYLGTYAIIATSKGVRAGIVGTNGDVSYGPLLFSDAACNDITFTDRFAYVSTTVDGTAGLIRIDLSSTIGNTLIFPWAWDLISTGTTTPAQQVSFFGNSDRLAYSVGNNIWAESTTSLVSSAYLQTGYIRYNTLESKLFKFLLPKIDNSNGAVQISSIDSNGVEYNIGSFSEGGGIQEIGIPYPTGGQEYIALKFTMSRSATNTLLGPLFTGYQVKALPGVPRQRLIQYPLVCFDHESDHFNNEIGYEGRAYDRMYALESVESVGDTVRVEDFRTGESYIGLIEEMDFTNRTPSDKRYSGFGGILLVTVRAL